MKTITISTENSETYSSISNFFIDYYMTEANGEFVKVYLYLVRLLNSSRDVTVAGIADHFNLTEKDICRAIKYWISKDVLRLNYDGKGDPSGIVLLPLSAPAFNYKTENDTVSILKVVPDVLDSTAASDTNSGIQASPGTNTFVTTPFKPDYSRKQIAEAFEDSDLADIQYLAETLFNKPLTPSNLGTILYIYDSLNFSVDLFEYLIEYCVEMKKTNCRYMEAVAVAWYNDGIKTRKAAKEQSMTTKHIFNMVFKALGIRQRMPTDAEVAFINTWSRDYGFSDELIKLACDKAILAKPGSANFTYVNGILENWHKADVRTPEDVERYDKAFISKNATSSLRLINNPNSFNQFKQTSMDHELDEMEQLFLKEVNGK